jgi:hypothetical protein
MSRNKAPLTISSVSSIPPVPFSCDQCFVVVERRNVFDINLEVRVDGYDNIFDSGCLLLIVDDVIVVEEAVVTALDHGG